MDKAPFKAGLAILDVTTGRKALQKRILAGEKVRVRVDMVLDGDTGNDDGVSREFYGDIQDIRVFRRVEKPRTRKAAR